MTDQPLSEFYRAKRNDIIARWRAEVCKLSSAQGLDQPTLTDHIPDLLEEIITDLARQRDGTLVEEHERGSPPVHGVQRMEDGFDIAEVVIEYQMLHEAMLGTALEHGFQLEESSRQRLYRRIGEATAMAVRAYAAHQVLEGQRRHEEHLSFITHDLRTPLGAISLAAQELEAQWPASTRAEAEESFGILRRNVQRLDVLVKRVLHDAAHGEHGSAFTPQSREFDLWPLVQRLIVDLRPLAEKERIALRNTIPRELEVFADAGLVSQVFQNLLGNAFRYTRDGEVVVSARRREDGAWVECEVRDTGAGIEPERLARVFDIGETDADPAQKSSGLGLTIVKQIVEAHGGKVRVASAPGAGATFNFTLPASARSAGES